MSMKRNDVYQADSTIRECRSINLLVHNIYDEILGT